MFERFVPEICQILVNFAGQYRSTNFRYTSTDITFSRFLLWIFQNFLFQKPMSQEKEMLQTKYHPSSQFIEIFLCFPRN